MSDSTENLLDPAATDETNANARNGVATRRDATEPAARGIAVLQQFFADMVEAAPLGVYLVDDDFRIREVNSTALSVFGGIPDLIGRDFDEVIHILWSQEYADELVALFRHTLETGEPYFVPERIEQRRDREVTEHYEWQINRVPLPGGRRGVVCYFRDVSAAVLARQKVAESEHMLSLIYDNSPDSLYLVEVGSGGQFRFRSVNERFLQVTGYTRAQLDQALIDDFIPAANLSLVRSKYQQVIGSRQLLTYEESAQGLGGLKHAEITLTPIFGAGDEITHILGVVRDITERKLAEESMRQLSGQVQSQLQTFGAMMSSVQDFIYQLDLEGRLTFVNQALLDLWRKSSEEAIGRNFHELDYPPELAEKLQRQIRDVIETGRPLRDETPYTSAIGRRDYEYIFAPLLDADGKVTGVAGVTRDITARRRTEEQLRESEERFRAMFEQANVGIVLVDSEGRCIEANPGVCHFLGYSEEELQQLQVRDLTHPDDYPAEVEMTRRLTAGEIREYNLEKRYLRKDGAVVWGTMTATLVRPTRGEALYTLAIIQAIGDRKVAEEKLRESEERFRTVADNVPQVIWTNEADGDANYVNRRWYEYSGLSSEESFRRGWQAIVHPEDGATAVERWNEALAAGKTFDAEYRLRRADGVYRWHIGRNVPLRGENGSVLSWFGTATDIEDFKEAEAGLRESEERFRLLVEGARDHAMFLMDPEGTIQHWSSGAERVFGWTAEEAIGRTTGMIFTPEDRASGEDRKEVETAKREGCATDRRWHRRKDGSRIWVDGVMRRLDHENGEIRGLAKIARDATELRKSEDKLREANEQLELRVHQRTQELQAMNESLEAEMMQRQSLEREVLRATEHERARISQDLHDSICQELTATAFLLKSQSRAVAEQNSPASAALAEAAEMVNANAGATRDLARGLHPLELGPSGLAAALRELAARTSESVTCRCHCPHSLRFADPTIAVNLYRIAQEAVNNALRHARPNEIVIRVERDREDVVMSVCDDGTPRPQGRRSKGLGLQMMKYRASVSGGTLTVESKRGKGTKIKCRVPLKA